MFIPESCFQDVTWEQAVNEPISIFGISIPFAKERPPHGEPFHNEWTIDCSQCKIENIMSFEDFECYHTQAWLDVYLQIFRTLVLPRIETLVQFPILQ